MQAQRNEIIIIILNLYDKRAMFGERWNRGKQRRRVKVRWPRRCRFFSRCLRFCTQHSLRFFIDKSSPKNKLKTFIYPKAMEHYDDDDDFYGL
jgi:hypothetical protein